MIQNVILRSIVYCIRHYYLYVNVTTTVYFSLHQMSVIASDIGVCLCLYVTHIALLARRWNSLKALTSWLDLFRALALWTKTLLERSREFGSERSPRNRCTSLMSKHNIATLYINTQMSHTSATSSEILSPTVSCVLWPNYITRMF